MILIDQNRYLVIHQQINKDNFIKMENKKCGLPGHNQRIIEALCLQPQCKNKRLLCVICIEKLHKNHEFTIIDDFSPNQKIHDKMVQQQYTNENDIQTVEKILNNLLIKPKLIIERVQKFKKEYYQSRILKMKELILDSFKNGSADQGKKRIWSPQITDPQIQKIVENIVRLGRPHLKTNQKLIDSLQFMMLHVEQVFEQSQRLVSKALDRMEGCFDEWDIFGDKNYINQMNKEKKNQEEQIHHRQKKLIESQKKLKKLAHEKKWKPLIDWTQQGQKFEALKKLQLNGGNQGFLGGIFGGSITMIQGFQPLINLRYLDLGCNSIQEIQNLHHMTKLIDLRLYSNQIKKIENLSNLKQLRILYLGGNKISRIENLDGLNCLQKLSLSNNKITKIENLMGLSKLDEVWLYANPCVKDPSKLREQIIDGKPITIALKEKNVKIRIRDLQS